MQAHILDLRHELFILRNCEQSVELYFGCFLTRTLPSIVIALVSFYVFHLVIATILAIFPVTRSVVSPGVTKLSFSAKAQSSLASSLVMQAQIIMKESKPSPWNRGKYLKLDETKLLFCQKYILIKTDQSTLPRVFISLRVQYLKLL